MQAFTAFLVLFSLLTRAFSVPLSTKSRWIIDDVGGQRVKLVGGNWAGHVGPMLPEGLDKRPLSEIAGHIALMGFNSVRLTYSTYMFTQYSHLTVLQSLRNLSLHDAIDGMTKAQEAVINQLASHGIMIVLDNQVSKPIWCCGDDDGNGFWGDEYFDPKDWLRSLHIVAHRYKNNPMVVAMSLRNEIRGKRQNAKDWRKYSNPNVLILVGGLSYALDLTPLKTKALNIKATSKLRNKIVYESHRYAFTMGQSNNYLRKPLNQFCDSVIADMENRTTFVTRGPNAAPLYISEFGVNMLGNQTYDNVFLGCFLAYLAKHDLDWNMWALQGSYYLRDEGQGVEEQYGMFTTNWTQIRNPDVHAKILSVQQMIRDPKSHAPRYLRMYHPMTGRCLSVNDNSTQIHATDCHKFSKWSYNNLVIQLNGTPYCLASSGEDSPLSLTTDCDSKRSTWKAVSSYQLADSDNLCMHYDPSYSPYVLARKCICAGSGNRSSCVENPQSQWFQRVLSNV
ncbi:hypothetical protein DCAR_0104993 [Daucus carota subsp. sativus]|uniref:Mannan endo-1,4-beta-mannosidase n=1 Tax=Daucus carota subsp. sativus TaxID=79200 RepID=A0AAF1AMT9_DAUCS|nr:hypothetical protein DCAR_0104993 [Daucus carota subsp. sativus]